MKRLSSIVTFAIIALFVNVHAQEAGKKKLEQDFEQYKQNRETDFHKFKKQREEELKKMAQEYQDYYNTMMGLKTYYVEKKDTAKANAVDDIIKFEESITYALGKRIKVTEQVKVTPVEEKMVETAQSENVKPYFMKRSEEQTSELQSRQVSSYSVFWLKKA